MARAFTSLLDLNGLLRSGSVKARGLVQEAARALEAEAGPGGAVRLIFLEEAVDAARAVERELKRGRTRGILQGAPFGVSELLQTARRAPVWDPETQAQDVEDAAAVSRLRSARAAPLALLASPAFGGVADGLGASEDACAAVVSRGLLPFAISLDFNGNVLRGALRRGCWALRPTFGTVSGFGTAPLSWTLGAVSVIARTPDDCGHVLAAMSGADSRCAHSPGRTFRFAPEYARPARGLRAADAGAEAGLRARLERSVAGVTAAQKPPGMPLEILEVVIAAEAGEALEAELAQTGQSRQYLEQARGLTAFEYLRAMRLRRALQDWYNAVLAEVDAVVFSVGRWVAGEPEESGESVAKEWFAAALLAGAPVLACGGVSEHGLPGFCLTGRAGAENTLLRLAAALAQGAPPSEKS